MSTLMRRIQKLCPCRRRGDVEEQDDAHETQDDERERQGQQDKGGSEQQSRMLLTLRDLQRTMNPLIAAQVFNNNHSPIGRLPKELLLYIRHCIGDGILTLYCLWRVSRTFRHLIDDPTIWKHMVRPLSHRSRRMTEAIWKFPFDLQDQLRQRLQEDGMCNECILWCNVPIKGLLRRIIRASNLDTNRRRAIGDLCKFETELGAVLYCNACGSYQNVLEFSSSNQDPDKRERQCLGRQGAVQLCEHVHVSWADVEAHIAYWQQRKPGEWKPCFNHSIVECHHPSHDTCCTAEVAPTWPRARLQSDDEDRAQVVLSLEWKPHSGLDAFTRAPDGRARPAELRALFQRYRQGPASILLSSYPSNPLPEMICFDTSKCRCLHYKMGNNKRPSAAGRGTKHGSFFRNDWPRGCPTCHCHLSMSGHRLSAPCLVCDKTDRGKINPTHAWFHAMDPDTYLPSSKCRSRPHLCARTRAA
ncbi:hypothetical protein QBC33DRAFT_580506 [Phialemonium atrogriseum]|uniref:F-box domain-containing protein n=1 Tax=Phialemonium atrogriseum TaxID=1093897 RepID=A0AAJ0BUL5_9PEZI|nr:uncharacterized protein QBC33DRAFT_580506 [Phialemonium atrogriseum]KAK1764297.1 hypothetical protein QBC33DRAFT_580506 [Phialemonium atrogriseum]